jgi:hypothetical protein
MCGSLGGHFGSSADSAGILLDRQITVDKPARNGRKEIFKFNCGVLASENEVEEVANSNLFARLTPGLPGPAFPTTTRRSSQRETSVTLSPWQTLTRRLIASLVASKATRACPKKGAVLRPTTKPTMRRLDGSWKTRMSFSN